MDEEDEGGLSEVGASEHLKKPNTRKRIKKNQAKFSNLPVNFLKYC